MSLDHDAIRASFPALKLRPDYIFADNAGGSQALQGVVDRVTDYLCNTNVQLGADYSIGKASTERVQQGIEAAAHLMNAASVNEVAFMPSSTMAIENLARALEADIKAGDEIIITQEHEGIHTHSIHVRYNMQIHMIPQLMLGLGRSWRSDAERS